MIRTAKRLNWSSCLPSDLAIFILSFVVPVGIQRKQAFITSICFLTKVTVSYHCRRVKNKIERKRKKRTNNPMRKITKIEWLACRGRNQHGLGLKPARAILFGSWDTTHSHAWWSWQAVLNFSHIYIKLKIKLKSFNRTVISWHLRKQVRVIACPMNSTLISFLRFKRINIEMK